MLTEKSSLAHYAKDKENIVTTKASKTSQKLLLYMDHQALEPLIKRNRSKHQSNARLTSTSQFNTCWNESNIRIAIR